LELRTDKGVEFVSENCRRVGKKINRHIQKGTKSLCQKSRTRGFSVIVGGRKRKDIPKLIGLDLTVQGLLEGTATFCKQSEKRKSGRCVGSSQVGKVQPGWARKKRRRKQIDCRKNQKNKPGRGEGDKSERKFHKKPGGYGGG